MSPLVHRRLRAPQDDGAALIDPPLANVPELVRSNRELARQWRCELQGRPLAAFALAARGDLLQNALDYTREYRLVSFVPPETQHAPFFLAGHQPELFHPGVWFKNFLLSAVAQREHGVAINLIVDTDKIDTTAIAVPTRDDGQPRIDRVAYDAPAENVPFEERLIRDERTFASFAGRVLASYESACASGTEPYEPLVESLWTLATTAAGRHWPRARLGRVLAEARHLLESLLGVRTLEVPLSTLAQTKDSRWFTAYLLAHLPRLRDVYNSALAEYRAVNHIRSRTHPASNLCDDDGWLEAPFLIWTKDDPRRRHLFVMRQPDLLVLSDHRGLRLQLEIAEDGRADKAVEQLADAEARGIKLRPRALITTTYARLVLSDLFVHGIGGAKYDELTDLIIRRFFGIEPPAYMTATATFRLPIERPAVSLDDLRRSARQIREARYRPEAFLRDPRVSSDRAIYQPLASLAAEKRDYLDRHDLRRCPPEVFQQLDRMNGAMRDLLRPVEEQLRAEHVQLVEQLKQSQLLASREFSFVLFPSEILPARLLDLCKVLS